MDSVSSTISRLVDSSVKVALGRFNGLLLCLERREVSEGDRKSLVFSYGFPLSANVERGFNPASFPSIASHGVNWLRSRLGVLDIPSRVEYRDDLVVYGYTLDLAQVFPTLSKRLRVRSLLDESGVQANFRVPYFVSFEEFMRIKKKLKDSEWERASEYILEKWKARALDSKVLEKVAEIALERG